MSRSRCVERRNCAGRPRKFWPLRHVGCAMKGLLRNRHRLRGLLPQRLRELALELAQGRGRRRRWDALPGVERVPAAGQLVLTLDDGPDPDATPAVLDALACSGERATFFIL